MVSLTVLVNDPFSLQANVLSEPSPFSEFASRTGLAPSLRAQTLIRRPSIESIGLHTGGSRMPYSVPIPSPSMIPPIAVAPPLPSSPIRTEATRPNRHHMRSYSSDALLPSTTSHIFVSPATPDATPVPPQPSTPGEQEDAAAVLAQPKRLKLFGFTPADGSQGTGRDLRSEDVVDAPVARSESPIDSLASFPFGSSVPLVPIPFRPGHLKTSSEQPPSSSHVQGLQDAFPHRKTAMVRKKSGELVRSSLKTGEALSRIHPRSAPATPTFPKYVHFDTQLEHVKHFLAQQRPAAVSRSGSPIETETEDEREAFPFPAMASATAGLLSLKLPNFPSPVNPAQDVYLETLEIAADGKSLRGITRVRNLAFEKWVAVRFTLDNWQTVSEVSAEHFESMGAMSDRFVFSIRLQDLLSRIEEKTMFIALRYTVGGTEIWDNNGGLNYRVEFAKRPAKAPSPSLPSLNSVPKRQQPWSVKGGLIDPMADLRRELDRLVKDDSDLSPTYGKTRAFTEGSPSTFSSRYDFGSSLKMFNGRSVSNGGLMQSNLYDSTPPAPPSSPPKPTTSMPSPSFLVGGMPATIFPEPSKAKAPSPLVRTSSIAPAFDSSYQGPSYFPSSNSSARPPSPTTERDLANIYSGYQPFVQEHDASRTRHHSLPGAFHKSHQSQHSSSIPSHYAPLQPPTFRSHRRNESPFASPAVSPVPSPVISPQSSSPPRSKSPPLYPRELPMWTPSSAAMENVETANSLTSSTASLTSSPYSPTSDVHASAPDSPLSGYTPRPGIPSDFSSFLDRVSPSPPSPSPRPTLTSSLPSSIVSLPLQSMHRRSVSPTKALELPS